MNAILDLINRVLESVSHSYGETLAVLFMVVLVPLVIALIIATYCIRLAKERFDTRYGEMSRVFDEIVTGLSTRQLTADAARAMVPGHSHKFLRRYIGAKICGTGPQNVSAERTLCDIAGLTDVLKRECEHSVGWKQALATRLLASLRGKEHIPLLRKVLAEARFSRTRFCAALGLALAGDTDSIPAILQRIYVANPPNREMILTALLPFGAAAAPKILEVVEKTTIPANELSAVLDIFGAFRYKPARSLLEKLLKSNPSSDIAIHAIDAIEHIGDASTCDIIMPFASAPDFRVRLKAVNSLERLAGKAHLGKAEAMLSDVNWWVRRNAAEALSRMGEEGNASLKAKAAGGDEHEKAVAKLVLAENKFHRMVRRYRYAESIA